MVAIYTCINLHLVVDPPFFPKKIKKLYLIRSYLDGTSTGS